MRAALLLAAGLLILTGRPARCADEPVNLQRSVLVALRDSPRVLIIDTDTNKLNGWVDAGVVPLRLALSESFNRLAVIDGTAASVSIINLLTRAIRLVPLPVVPRQLAVSPDGLVIAVTGSGDNRLVLVDVLHARPQAVIADLPMITDMVFSSDSTALYLASDRAGVLEVIDVLNSARAEALSTGLDSASAAIRRTPDGRTLFVQQAGGGAIGVVDLQTSAPLRPIPAGAGATVAFPSATGAWTFVADNTTATMTVRHGIGAQPRVLKGAKGVDAVYSAWFDTVAFAPSDTAHALLVYDTETPRLEREMPLHGTPLTGAVTPDGKTLYLPLADPPNMAVIDARTRRIVALIPLEANPAAALLAGGYGVCH